MKKFFLAALVAATLGLTSCGNTEGCYAVTSSYGGISATAYVWGTQNDVDAAVATAKQATGSAGFSVTSKKVNKSQSECSGTVYDY